jgi:hypothetical protein
VPAWLEITLGALLALLVLLTLGGMLANARAQARDRERREAELVAANQALAAAHAQDNGWERSVLEATARAAHDAAHPETPATELALVQVIDPPGVDDDKAIFRVVSAGGESRLTLGRQGGEWRPE